MKAFILFGAALLASCAQLKAERHLSTVQTSSELMRGINAFLPGNFSNAAQFAAADLGLKKPPAAGFPYAWLDSQSAHFFRIEAPLIGKNVFYLEWRSIGATGPISRQRIWSFRETGGELRMDFFTFKVPKPFEGAGGVRNKFQALRLEDLIGYGPACGLLVRASVQAGLLAKTTPAECSLVARSGRTMGIDAEVTFSRHAITYREAGILEDGSFAFKVPGGPPYRFIRYLNR